MKTLAILLGEHLCTVNIVLGPRTVHYRAVLLYLLTQLNEHLTVEVTKCTSDSRIYLLVFLMSSY